MYGKKAQNGSIQGIFLALMGAALAFLVLVIALSLIGQILGAQQDLQRTTASNLAVNETVSGNGTLANAGTVTLGNNIDNSTVRVVSGDAVLVEGVNYSLTTVGVYTAFDLAGSTESNVSYNYTVVTDTIAANVSGSGLTGTSNIADLTPTMGLLIGIIALLGLLAVLAVMFVGRNLGGSLDL